MYYSLKFIIDIEIIPNILLLKTGKHSNEIFDNIKDSWKASHPTIIK
jgi:hypothetical protein